MMEMIHTLQDDGPLMEFARDIEQAHNIKE